VVEIIRDDDMNVPGKLFIRAVGHNLQRKNDDRRELAQAAARTNIPRSRHDLVGCARQRNQNQIGAMLLDPLDRFLLIASAIYAVAVVLQKQANRFAGFLDIFNNEDSRIMRRQVCSQCQILFSSWE